MTLEKAKVNILFVKLSHTDEIVATGHIATIAKLNHLPIVFSECTLKFETYHLPAAGELLALYCRYYCMQIQKHCY